MVKEIKINEPISVDGTLTSIKTIKEELINEIDQIFMYRFDCDGIRTDWTNADIRETIHFELEQLKK